MFSSTSLSKLAGCDPDLIDRLVRLEDAFNAIGGDLTIPDYGGFRTFQTQAQLVAWRDEAVAAGQSYYAVAPAGTSAHESGRAGDVKVIIAPPGISDPYRWLADRAEEADIGLVAGFYFHGGPPNKGSDPFHFELPGSSGLTAPPPPGGIPVSTVPPWRTITDGPSGGGSAPTDGSDTSGSPPSDSSTASWLELDPGVTIGVAALAGILLILWVSRRGGWL